MIQKLKNHYNFIRLEEIVMVELIWICPMLGTTDYIESDETETVRDVATRLLWKYNEQIIDTLSLGYTNIRDVGMNMLTLKLYQIVMGRKTPVSLRDSIGNIVKQSTKIYWNAEPVGGTSSDE